MLIFFIFPPLWAQEQPASADSDVFSLIGLKLSEVIGRFGAPKMVYSARGNELWQDDVVFQYEKAPPIGAVDFFIYRDRVWQVKVASVNGIAVGEPKQSALTVLGSEAEDRADHLLMKVSDRDWPLMLRVNINNGTGRVASIYIYRIDF